MRRLKREKSALRYRIDRIIRDSVMKVMTRLTPDLRRKSVELQPERVHKILVVRALFRMGDTILATPAVRLLRNNFPAARIDFVGPPISRRLFENLPIDRHYSVTAAAATAASTLGFRGPVPSTSTTRCRN